MSARAALSNNDTQTMTFINPVNFSGVASSTINASVGGLTFINTVTLPTGTLTVTAGPDEFHNISGAGALNKTGTGTMTWTPNVSQPGFDIQSAPAR